MCTLRTPCLAVRPASPRRQGCAHAAAFELASTPEEDAASRSAASFHLALPVHDLAAARRFYGGALGLAEGRSSERWVDYNFEGHQLVLHLVEGWAAARSRNAVDGDPVPVPHFGLALSLARFHALSARLAAAGVVWELAPHVRFTGQPGEQWCAFCLDPSGNALELKAMTVPENLFARYVVRPG